MSREAYDPVQHQIHALERIATALERLADNQALDDSESWRVSSLMCASDCGCAGGQPHAICTFRPSCTRCAPHRSASEPIADLDDEPRNYLELDDCR